MIAAKRRIRVRIVRYSRRVAATSASWIAHFADASEPLTWDSSLRRAMPQAGFAGARRVFRFQKAV